MSTTLATLLANIARSADGYATGAPSSNGTTLTLIDASADSPLDTGDNDKLFVNAYLKISADSAGTPRDVGEVSRITTYTTSSGTLTVGRAFSYLTTTTMTYELYLGLPPTTQGINRGITQFINDVLRRLFYRRQFLLTLVTDGDMETSGVTNWTAGNSATLTKSTTTGITLGKQALRVANSGASGYAQSATVNVEESQTYLLAADVTVASGTAVLELYDVTNSASIDTVECTQRQTRRVWLSASIPDDCMQVAVRLSGTEASADCYYDNVTLLNQNATEMPLPSWFKERKWLEKVSLWRYRGGSADGTTAAVDSIDRAGAIWFDVLEDRTGYAPFKVQLDGYPLSGCHLIGQALCPYDELSADADSTEADADWIKYWVLFDIYADPDRDDKAKAAYWLAKAQDRDKLFQPRWDGKRFQMKEAH